MLKLLIVDDEKIICDTIANIVDWTALGIQLVGTCSDGVEAYHTILDESPDIVMTDIQMPGIDGLELIERISKTNLNVHFIILSGYTEFEYAKRSMKYGVRHYLLKPCDENQIAESIKEIKKELQHDLLFQQVEKNRYHDFQPIILQNMISEGCSISTISDSFFESFEQYINLYDNPYELYYIYFLEEKELNGYLEKINTYFHKNAPQLPLHKIYVTNVLLLFFPVYDSNNHEQREFFQQLQKMNNSLDLQYERSSFANITSLLKCIITKIKRYDTFYFIDKEQFSAHFNYHSLMQQSNQLTNRLLSPHPQDIDEIITSYQKLFEMIHDKDFLIQLSGNILIMLSTHISGYSPADVVDFLTSLHSNKSIEDISQLTVKQIATLVKFDTTRGEPYRIFIKKTLDYLDEHYADSDLTLKWIAENYLFMNVNYVSRCFQKEAGEKFSSYLVNLRIQKAKKILLANDAEKIKNIAELVGCGNNPYYFSKIFKKSTGMTPSAYIRHYRK